MKSLLNSGIFSNMNLRGRGFMDIHVWFNSQPSLSDHLSMYYLLTATTSLR